MPRITSQQSTSIMKKIPLLPASLLIGSLVISSCSSSKMAANSVDDNVYFMASDVKMATQFAVENNNPQSFKGIAAEPTLTEENFSSRNVNPEYISRYQASTQPTDLQEGVLYFDETAPAQNTTGNINAYDNYSSFTNGAAGNGPTINFNMGFGFGNPWAFGSPWGMGFYDPFWNPWGPWGFRPGFSVGIGWGFGNPFWGPSFGMGGFWGPSYGWGYPMYPVYPGYPSYVLPGGEYGDRRVVYGARPTRGSSITNSGIRSNEASIMPNTARAQARGNAAAASNSSARRVVSSENSRVATRDFSNSQNDYYNSGRSRVTTTRNVNSPAADRSGSTRSSNTIPSARPSSSYTPGTSTRSYTTPSTRGGYSGTDVRTSNPSYNRSTSPSYDNRSTSPSYNRGTTPSYNRSSTPSYNRSVTPSRSYDNNSSSYSAPSRMSTGGSSYSAPSRSSSGYSGGSSGGSAGGSRGGRGN